MIHRKGLVVAAMATLVLAAAPSFSQDRSSDPPATDGTTWPPKDPTNARPPRPQAAKDRDKDRDKERDKDHARDHDRDGDRKMGMAPDGTRPPPHRRPPRPDGDAQAQKRPPAPPANDGKTGDGKTGDGKTTD